MVSATNADLQAAIASGTFREDLYYRLNEIELRVPPLAERPGDVPALAQAFLPSGKRLTAAAERLLAAQPWPGNVRELQNLMKRVAVLAAGDVVDIDDLGLGGNGADRELPEPSLEDVRRALALHDNVVARAARELGLSRQALYRRMVKFGLHEQGSGN